MGLGDSYCTRCTTWSYNLIINELIRRGLQFSHPLADFLFLPVFSLPHLCKQDIFIRDNGIAVHLQKTIKLNAGIYLTYNNDKDNSKKSGENIFVLNFVKRSYIERFLQTQWFN